MHSRFWISIFLLTVLLSIAVVFYLEHLDTGDEQLTLALLIPDDARLDDPYLTAWLDAAAEEGLPLETVSASAFLSPNRLRSIRFAGIILPDTIHKMASDALLEGLDAYVRTGGKLMVIYDAGTLVLSTKAYAPQKSRLSRLVGIDYSLYEELKDQTIWRTPVFGSPQTFLSLHIPPGKFSRPLVKNPGDGVNHDDSWLDDQAALFAYGYGIIPYPHFGTRGTYSGGQSLLQTSGHELVAGVRDYEAGQVLFVNLPLGYLKTRSDGLLLHAFLRYFGADLVQLPYLSSAPNGLGGLVMNWHIDSNAAFPALKQMKTTKLFEQGPYSVHITAGPNMSEPDDGLGFNVPGNPEAQQWLRFFAQRGDAVGSHGGWIHNYFGFNINETNRTDFEPYLELNKQAIESVTQRPVTEYSAPVGNQPAWVTAWLDERGILAYYTVSNTGMGPTKPYRNDQRSPQKAWAFPVLSLSKYAVFEEMARDHLSEQDVVQWLKAVTDFVANDHVIRLIYFHPPGFISYLNAAETWLERARELNRQGDFSWYTMTDVATFLNERQAVNWRVTRRSQADVQQPNDDVFVVASHPVSLARQSWRLAADRYGEPTVLRGAAEVLRDGNDWLVRAKGGTTLVFKVTTVRLKID